ncbi:MAG: flagellar biosynthetic protein FliR [Beijerinckiaceae bacterium]
MTITLLPEFAAAFVLVFARIGTIVMLMPGIGDRSIPARIRLSFALLLSLLFLPLIRATIPPLSGGIEPFIKLLILEILIGLMLGTSVRMTLSAMQVAGTVIAQQMGLSFSATVDPSAGVQNPTIATFLILVTTGMIFALDLHHLSIRGMHDSYQMIVPGAPPPVGDATQFIVQTFVAAFKIGIQISAPFLVFAIIFNIGLGILSRLMPALQIFFLAMPATILIGTIILFTAIGVMMNVFLNHFGGVLGRLIVQ